MPIVSDSAALLPPQEDPVPLSEIDTAPTPPLFDPFDGTVTVNPLGDNEINTTPDIVDPAVDPEFDPFADTVTYPADDDIRFSAGAVTEDAYVNEEAAAAAESEGAGFSFSSMFGFGDNSPATSAIQQGVRDAQQQQTLSSQQGQQASATDWRVRISLAKGANYLYNDPTPGILQPLRSTNGVIFPYTPKIDLSYKANYQQYDMTHSNFRGYYYQNSNVGDISITGHFTAQNTQQANYLLAVIHFFRSATKMFYGQDAQRGTPPPLVFLSGMGQYQFNNHSCLISEFTYSLPDEVDYIRAGVINNVGLNAATVSNVLNSGVASGAITGAARLAAAFTTPGALPATPFGSLATPNLASGAPTYVPTKMDITVRLLPVQTRQQASQQFSVKNFANGNLLRGGFW